VALSPPANVSPRAINDRGRRVYYTRRPRDPERSLRDVQFTTRW
jgi:hypothetical protein